MTEQEREGPQARVVRVADLVEPAGATPGMLRQEAFRDEGAWVGTVHTEPGVLTGWHHHGDYETYVYMVAGEGRLEYGPGGATVATVGPGEFLHIPRGVIHREGSAAGSRGVDAVLVRVGRGQLVFDSAGPEDAAAGSPDGDPG